jgi:YHS domain-containing protein
MSMAIDPVCGMSVEDSEAPKSTYYEREYFFCSEDCRHQFESDPARYLEQAA